MGVSDLHLELQDIDKFKLLFYQITNFQSLSFDSIWCENDFIVDLPSISTLNALDCGETYIINL